jgi:glycosyltransferase involved in cell wall biosynthesis
MADTFTHRIGIDARLNYYRQGGISRYTEHLLRAFSQLDTTSDFSVLHSRKDGLTRTAAPNQRRVNCWTPAHHRIERLALALELLPQHLDLLHSPDFIPPLGGFFKSVITVHDLAFLKYPDILDASSHRYYTDQIGSAIARADAIISVSQATRTDLIEMLDAPSEKIHVIYEAAGEDIAAASISEIERVRTAFNLPAHYILFMGTYEPRKNIGGLLNAYRLLRASLPTAPPLALVGRRGWLYTDSLTLIRTLGLGEHVRLIENAADSDLAALYTGASMLVLPSFYEGFGLPVLEAQACGTPVITSDRGSLPEVAGKAALLINPEDVFSIASTMEHILTDPALADRLRNDGLINAARFSWQQAARETLDIYRKVLNDG